MGDDEWFRSWKDEKAYGMNTDGMTWKVGPYTKESILLLSIGCIVLFCASIYLLVV